MNPERWQQVREVLDKAIALPGDRRGAYLDKVCSGDAALRSEVESLLRSHERAGSVFLEDPVANLKSATPASGDAPVRSARRIGPYLVEKEIGHGGMGEVFSAIRADGQYEKKVAIKLVRAGYDTAFVLERFRNERQILAGLDHPNIARLLDGGTTDDGIPYLVMEIVEGVPINDYCDAGKHSVTQRLQLFRQVCAAVQYAHQRLVIHRDIKPSNILVTPEGVPKLLDFGIAKILDASGIAEATVLRPMTPEYASPEQIRGDPITTATDVYSLGVVLYQVLTGHSPYRLDTHTPAKLAEAITHDEPERPSTSVQRRESVKRNGESRELTPESVSSTREASPLRLQRRLRGDLDFILLKALRKEPSLRYASAGEFAEDIRNHLERLPVKARKGTWSYRAGKFVRRNRAGVAAATLVLVTLVTGVIITLREARIADANRRRAEKRFNDVRELSDSLIFDVHDAIQNLPGATPARKLLLDRALQYLDAVASDSAGNPDLQRELAWGYQRIAVVQGSPTESNLGDQQAAEVSDHKALQLFEAVAQANPTNIIDQLNVAMMHRILAFSALLDPGGKKNLQDAMAITERLIKAAPSNPKVLSERSIEYQNLALMQDALGDRAHALDSYRQNQALKQDLFRTNSNYRQIRRSLGMATVMLGSALARSGMRQEALNTIQQGMAFYDSVPKGEDDINLHRERAISQQKLGDILLMNGDTDAALLKYKQSWAALEPMAKADPQNTMLQLDAAFLDYHQARALVILGKYDEAVVRLSHAASVFSSLHANARSADDSPHGLGAIEIWLGEAYAGKGNRRAALQHYQKATNALGPSPTAEMDADTRCELAVSYSKTAAGLARLGKLTEAENAYKKALDIVTPMAIPEHHDVPALYILADATAGLQKLVTELAHSAPASSDRTDLEEQAHTLHQQALSSWAQIPNPSRINPSGFLVARSVAEPDRSRPAVASRVVSQR